MICLAHLGDRTSAIRAYDNLVRALRNDLGVKPARETVALRDKLAERTDGRLQIELHAAGSLMAATEIFPAVRRGVIEMGYTSPAYLMNQIPTAGLAFAVPGAFEEVWCG